MASQETFEDQEFRNAIAHDLDQTMLVEAGAGTGKTTSLIARMVNLLRTGRCGIDTLAAVTFTRKAAAELRSRFQLELERESRKASGVEQNRLVTALERIDHCLIGTIHSLCARLLRERPVEAGIDPGFVELDDTLDAELRTQAWREHVATLLANDDPILPELQELGLKVSPSTRRSYSVTSDLDELGLEMAELGPAFLEFAKYPDVRDWPHDPVAPPDYKQIAAAVREYLEHIEQLELPQNFGNDKLMPRYEQILRAQRHFKFDEPAQLMEFLERFDHSAKVVQKIWPEGREQALAEDQRWKDFRTGVVQPALYAWREHRYEPVMRAIQPALETYDRLRQERNALNFQDLLIQSAKLLREHPDVRTYFRQRFTHLLVDEFQDTDPIQAEVMLLLTASDPHEHDWQQCQPVPGSLFVVGDPKQSIYRFRRADIQIYNWVWEIIKDCGGGILPLTTNFRSLQKLIDWGNGCFNELFPSETTRYSPQAEPLTCGRKAVPAKGQIYKLSIPTDLKNQNKIAEYEADRIARTVRQALNEKWPVPRSEDELQRGIPEHAIPSDFLIVTRNKARLSTYARHLQKHAIPHRVSGGSLLEEIPELQLLYECLSALVNRDDPIALVAVLRGPLFGIADTTLYQYKRAGGRFAWYASIPEELNADDAKAMSAALNRLQRYASWLVSMSFSAAAERIAADLGLLPQACAASEGDVHAGSLLKAIELVRAHEQQGTRGDMLDVLRCIAEGEYPSDGQHVVEPEQPPVRVMNLHQCKGLEAPFVFLADPSGDRDGIVNVHIDRSSKTPKGYLPIYGPKTSQYGPRPSLAYPRGWQAFSDSEVAFEEAEHIRLLYVAATRAGSQLIISQRSGKQNDRNPWQLFAEDLAGIPELPAPPECANQDLHETAYDENRWEQEIAAIADRWNTVLTPSYEVHGLKEYVIEGQQKPRSRQRGGAQWGQVVHTLLEAAAKSPRQDLKPLALASLSQEGLSTDLLDEVVGLVDDVLQSDLWQRSQNAQRRLVEVPFALPAQNNESIVLRGVIDLVFKEAKGWVIVDYKSERVDKGEFPALVSYYRPQVDAYADAWQSLTGEPVVERGVLFTHEREYMSWPEADAHG